MGTSKQGAALIVPAWNEAPVIGEMLRRIPPGLFRQVIVADNGSDDGTGEIASGLGATVVREPRRGYGAACLKALSAVSGQCDVVVFMQADASEDAAEAAQLLAPIFDGRADMVLGSRVLGRAERGALLPHQRFGNWLATGLIRLLYRHVYTDLGPFRAIRLESLRALGMRELDYGWTVEMQVKALRRGLRVMEVPVSYGLRKAGENKVSGNLRASVEAGWKILWTVARLSLPTVRRAPN